MNEAELAGATRLLVLQPTAFCNIDCDYCYLPARTDRHVMSHDIVASAVRLVYENGLAAPDFTVVWHAGEPLLVPPDWYEEAFRRIAAETPEGRVTPHAIQTNGMLIDARWCDLFLAHDIRVGVSIDGPAFLHDARRRTRAGQGTHAKALAGLRQLVARGVPCHVIAVITAASLPHAEAIADFFHGEGVTDIGLNIEEVEGAHGVSSLARPGIATDFRTFYDRLLARAEALAPRLNVREYRNIEAMLQNPGFRRLNANSQNMPMAMVTVGSRGEVFTFSPELAGLRDERYGDFAIGRLPQDSLAHMLAGDSFRRQAADIRHGVDLCRQSCAYFDMCLGGAPVNKLAECGSFVATETLACLLSQQVMCDVALHHLEHRLDRLGSPSAAAVNDVLRD